MTERPHPAGGDLYTPEVAKLHALLARMRDELGSWRAVAAASDTRLKVLRNLRSDKRKAVSQRVVDRICTGTGIGAVHEFTWFTANDLVAMGIWDPVQYVEGRLRVKGDDVHLGQGKKIRKARKQVKRRKRRRK